MLCKHIASGAAGGPAGQQYDQGRQTGSGTGSQQYDQGRQTGSGTGGAPFFLQGAAALQALLPLWVAASLLQQLTVVGAMAGSQEQQPVGLQHAGRL